MSLRWSSLHAALGLLPQPLQWEHIDQLVRRQVAEDADLDWKRALPIGDSRALDEFAKDVAAMANSGGGCLVFGVAEQRGRGTAAEIAPVDVSESVQQRLRAGAASRIRPLVGGIDFTVLRAASSDSLGVLIVSIASSPDAPHSLEAEGRLGIPYRHGRTTRWMNERELERAYEQRFRGREQMEDHLESLQTHLLDQIDRTDGPWFMAVATPTTPMQPVRPLPAEHASTAMRTSLTTIREIVGTGDGGSVFIRDLGDAGHNPRTGLRRWLFYRRSTDDPNDASHLIHVEIHHDGTVAFAVDATSWGRPRESVQDRHPIYVGAVEQFAAELAALVAAAASVVGTTSSYLVRVDIPASDDLPLAGVDQIRAGHFEFSELEQPRWTRSVRHFLPVLATWSSDAEAMPRHAAELALDVLNQFGFNTLRRLAYRHAEDRAGD